MAAWYHLVSKVASCLQISSAGEGGHCLWYLCDRSQLFLQAHFEWGAFCLIPISYSHSDHLYLSVPLCDVIVVSLSLASLWFSTSAYNGGLKVLLCEEPANPVMQQRGSWAQCLVFPLSYVLHVQDSKLIKNCSLRQESADFILYSTFENGTSSSVLVIVLTSATKYLTKAMLRKERFTFGHSLKLSSSWQWRNGNKI